jgi:hypothetical protein
LRKTNWRSFRAIFWRISSAGMPSARPSAATSRSSASSSSSGVAQIDSTAVEIASGEPWRSSTLPREAGSSIVRA